MAKIQIVKYLEEITREEAPHLHAALDDLCHKAAIDKPPLMRFLPQHAPSPLEKYLDNYNAGAWTFTDKSQVIVLGDGFRESMGHHQLHDPVSDEFKAIIAHELGHFKNGDSSNALKIKAIKYAPHVGAAIGASGTLYYEYLSQQKQKHLRDDKSEQDATAAIRSEWEKSDVPATDTQKYYQYMLTAAKCMAGALLGLTAGIGANAIAHRLAEFGADRVSAELMGDGKPLARALVNSRKGEQNIVVPPEAQEAFMKQSPLQMILYHLTHPSDAERIERLNNWSR